MTQQKSLRNERGKRTEQLNSWQNRGKWNDSKWGKRSLKPGYMSRQYIHMDLMVERKRYIARKIERLLQQNSTSWVDEWRSQLILRKQYRGISNKIERILQQRKFL